MRNSLGQYTSVKKVVEFTRKPDTDDAIRYWAYRDDEPTPEELTLIEWNKKVYHFVGGFDNEECVF